MDHLAAIFLQRCGTQSPRRLVSDGPDTLVITSQPFPPSARNCLLSGGHCSLSISSRLAASPPALAPSQPLPSSTK